MRTIWKLSSTSLLLAGSMLAHAQSNVTVGGQLKLGVDQTSYKGGTGGSAMSATRVTDNSSWFFFKGEEDLGSGNKAYFHYEQGFSADSGAMGAARFSAVGLGNKDMGRILLGQWSTYFASDSMISPEGISNATPYSTGTLNVLGPIGKRGQYFSGGFLPNTIRYESPRWNNTGFSASYAFDTETAGQSSNRTLNLNPTYQASDLTLYANFLKRNNQPKAAGDFSSAYEQNSTRLGAGYQFNNGIKVAALWDRNTVEGTAITGGKLSRDAWALPVSYTTGPHKVSLTWGKAQNYTMGGASQKDTSAVMNALSYQYALSKRTFLAASYSTVKNEAQAAYDFWYPTNTLSPSSTYKGFTSSYTYVGLKHTF